MSVEFRSADGLEWTAATLPLRGVRSAAIAFDGGAVAVGQRGEQLISGPSGTDAPEQVGASEAGSIWITG